MSDDSPNSAPASGVLEPGRNCWRLERASRLGVLVDAEEYFAAVHSIACRAERSISILGWDFEPRIGLLRGENRPESDFPFELGSLLNALLEARPQLHIDVLIWDFAMIYALERDWMPLVELKWKRNPRLRFRFDGEHPVGASHHQKIVVVDDTLAFVGGMDLSKWRWDTRSHAGGDSRRTDPAGKPYPPIHDLQLVLGGDIATALGDLVRERWRRLGEEVLEPREPSSHRGELWPDGVEPLLRDVDVAIARTAPRYRSEAEIREVERLFLDSIAAARHSIYIENQYFTSNAVGDALARRLEEDGGPEIIAVLPRRCAGWLERKTMDVLRDRLIERLRRADRHGRLEVLYPDLSGLEDEFLVVHSKTMIVDDTLLRVGSANLSNRSMGLDTECDLALEARGSPEVEEAIRSVRDDLLAEHLGASPGEVRDAARASGSLAEVVRTLGDHNRRLRPLEPSPHHESLDSIVPDVVDPEGPIPVERYVEEYAPEDEGTVGFSPILRIVILLVLLLGMAAAWRWTPLNEWIDLETLAESLREHGDSPLTPVWVLAAFLLGSLVLFPVTLLLVATGIAFGSVLGFMYSLAGFLSSAALGYGLGRLLGRDAVRRMTGSKLQRINSILARRGLLTVVLLRAFPVAPFTVVNLVAGASRLSFREFVLGSLLGSLPSLLAINVFGDQLAAVLRRPDAESFAVLGAVVILLAVVAVGFRRFTARRREPGQGGAGGAR